METIISLLAVAISFIDAEIAKRQKTSDVSSLVDARHGIAAIIALLRGDTDADEKIEAVNRRRKDKIK